MAIDVLLSRRHWRWLVGAPLERDVFLKLVSKQFEAALDQHGRAGHQRAIAGALHEPAELQQAVEILLRSLALFNLGHEGLQIDRPHAAGWALAAAFDLEKT